MKIDNYILHREPFRSVIEHTQEMALAIVEVTGKHGLMRISLTPDLGLAFGALPGQSIQIMTAVGQVDLYVEATPRSYGTFTVD